MDYQNQMNMQTTMFTTGYDQQQQMHHNNHEFPLNNIKVEENQMDYGMYQNNYDYGGYYDSGMGSATPPQAVATPIKKRGRGGRKKATRPPSPTILKNRRKGDIYTWHKRGLWSQRFRESKKSKSQDVSINDLIPKTSWSKCVWSQEVRELLTRELGKVKSQDVSIVG